ncbi:MAG TPA: glycosyltransferase family 2 protein [Candidatus Saccharimonadales bacterium]|jgi:hypothetical protein
MLSGIPLLLLTTLAAVALIDYIPKAINAAKKPVSVVHRKAPAPDYLLMPTVYGDISYLKNLEFLRQYADHVVICTSLYESFEFYTELSKVCHQYGLRFICAELPKVNGKPVKNAYTIYKGAFANLAKLGAASDTPCILIDADTYATTDVNDLARTFADSGLDVASLRCEVSNPQTLLEVLQAYEYKLAMDNRRMDAWLTSGACNMAKASVSQHVFTHHSDFFAGGDIEIGKLAHIMGYTMGHIDFTFYTEVPSTFMDWYHQRIIWFAGGVRHHVINIAAFSWQHYFIFFYNSLIVYLLLPLRWVELVNYPLTFFLLIGFAWLYVYIANVGRGWRKEYLVLPAYAFIQSMVILPVAVVRYCKYAWRQRSLGLLKYDLGYAPGFTRALFRTLNVAAAAFVVGISCWFTVDRIEYWSQHGAAFHALFSALR